MVALIAYVLIPIALGTGIASSYVRNRPWSKRLVGETAAPTAWDAIFAGTPTDSFVILKLKSGQWVGGQYAEGSYAGGYPEPADLYLVRELLVDQQTHDFVVDEEGEEVEIGSYGLLVRWDEVEYLEIGD